MSAYLAIEIGGTKLQLGVGCGQGGPLAALTRLDVDPSRGAEGIRRQIEQAAPDLIRTHQASGVGIGFGGPVDAAAGRTITSHHVEGWNDFPIVAWCRQSLGLPAVLGNDSDLAGLGEARFGAGRGHRIVFYSNVGTGIGGALVIDGRLYTGSRGVASELGHLRPGLHCEDPEQTLESISAGWGIAAAAAARLDGSTAHPFDRLADRAWPSEPEAVRQRLIEEEENDERCAADLLRRCHRDPERLSAQIVAQAAVAGNEVARDVFDRACRAYGWALAQMITLLSPDAVVLGGGVSLAGDELFLNPVRGYVRRYVFPPLVDSYQILPAALGEEVVLHGALALAAGAA
jgi:glucokinase